MAADNPSKSARKSHANFHTEFSRMQPDYFHHTADSTKRNRILHAIMNSSTHAESDLRSHCTCKSFNSACFCANSARARDYLLQALKSSIDNPQCLGKFCEEYPSLRAIIVWHHLYRTTSKSSFSLSSKRHGVARM